MTNQWRKQICCSYHWITINVIFTNPKRNESKTFGKTNLYFRNYLCQASFLTCHIQYIPRNMHTAFALLCFVVVIHWLIIPYPSGLLHWHCGNLTIAPVPAKQPRWIWINTSCEFIMNDCITTTKQSTTKPCAYFSGYTVYHLEMEGSCWQLLRRTIMLKNRYSETCL